jgi:hypothetical protein
MMASKAIAVTAADREEKTEAEMEAFKKNIRDTVNLFGCLVMTPFIFCLGVCYGIRAGIITGLRKTLELYTAWNR